MVDAFSTDQEAFWAGEFGDEYVQRNRGSSVVAANTALFARVLGATRGVGSVLEYGANAGLNLRAIRSLLPAAELTGVDINAKALEELAGWGGCRALPGSLLDAEPAATADLVLVKGVLIHIAPERLADAYRTLHQSSRRWICIAEYYSRVPTGIAYRGHDDRLWKRDFAGEHLDAHPGTRLVDYGFSYHRDPAFPQDDITWFLLEKTS